jgi:hypothetical protein
MKIPGRSETTAGSAASKSFSISRAGPTAPVPGPVWAPMLERTTARRAPAFFAAAAACFAHLTAQA